MSSDMTDAGERIQRCYGCFTGFHVKDMYRAEDGSYYCEDCKDDSMIPFNEFSPPGE